MNRPKYIKCIEEPGNNRKTCCGRKERPFFVGKEHAEAAIEKSRVVPCPECLKRIKELG